MDEAHHEIVLLKEYYRRRLQKMITGYLILAVGAVVGVWLVTARSDQHLRHDINKLARLGCLANIKTTAPIGTIIRYNQHLEVEIQTYRDARELNLARGDKERAEINQKSINATAATKLHVPTAAECAKPILKG